MPNPVNHPAHYECIDVAELMNFNLGNAMKYLWRAHRTGNPQDLRKAQWYIIREQARMAGAHAEDEGITDWLENRV